MKTYYLYILANRKHGTLYIDITDNIIKSILEFRDRLAHCTKKKNVKAFLVYYEKIGTVHNAIKEKSQIERWDRFGKHILIEKFNLEWKDLFYDLNYQNQPGIPVTKTRKEVMSNNNGDLRLKNYLQQRCDIIKNKIMRR